MHPFFKAMLEADTSEYDKAHKKVKAAKKRQKQIKRKRRQTVALAVAAHTGRAVRNFLK